MAFLKTLTDRTLLSDPRFSNPFERKGAVERVRAAVLAVRASLLALGDGAAHRLDVLRSAVNIETPPAPLPPGATSPYLQINRLMSFDGNRDHRLSRDELPERLQGLVARADRNGDAALDSDEIGSFANLAETQRIGVGFRFQPSDGLPGVINDLKLPPAKHAWALHLVSPDRLPRRVTDSPGSDLYREMRVLLDDEEYENFVAAAARVPRMPQSVQ